MNELTFIRAQIVETERLLERVSDHPIMGPNLRSRLEMLRVRLLSDTPVTLESKPDSTLAPLPELLAVAGPPGAVRLTRRVFGPKLETTANDREVGTGSHADEPPLGPAGAPFTSDVPRPAPTAPPPKPLDAPKPDQSANWAADDKVLMAAVSAGDRHALSVLYDRHAPLLRSICRRVLNDDDDADDVLVDVMYEVWAKPDRFDLSRASPISYLAALAHARSIDRRRSRDSRPPLRSNKGDELAAHPDDGASPLVRAKLDEQSAMVRAALSNLTEEQRQAMECAFYEGMSHSEVAARLGKPLGTVKILIRQGLVRLRNALRIDARSTE